MKLSIRLQNHGCANHPYWWIVVAPNRKNIKGRFIEHVGYWAPRQGVLVDRQITLNLPRIKYWMGNGAVPTPKVQLFLNHWDLMPRPFYVESSKPPKPEEEMTERDKIKAERKRKRAERLKLDYINYHRKLAKFKSLQTYNTLRHETKLKEKINAAEKENQILRDLLMHNEFVKINRINELSGKAVMDDTQELLRLEQELKKAKAELALLDKNIKGSSPMQKIEVMKSINALVDKIRAVELQRQPFRKRTDEVFEGQSITKAQLDRELEYELITKKLQKMNKQMDILEKLYEVVTLEEYANYLRVQTPGLQAEEAHTLAERFFIQRGQNRYPPLTKFDLYYAEELDCDPDEIIEYDEHVEFSRSANYAARNTQQAEEQEQQEGEQAPEEEQGQKVQEGQEAGQGEVQVQAEPEQENVSNKRSRRGRGRYEPEQGMTLAKLVGKEINVDIEAENDFINRVHEQHILKFMMIRPDTVVPTNRPVHPFPDLNTYIPEQYYEPIADVNLKVVHLNSLEPNDQLQKYHQKRVYTSTDSSKGINLGRKRQEREERRARADSEVKADKKQKKGGKQRSNYAV